MGRTIANEPEVEGVASRLFHMQLQEGQDSDQPLSRQQTDDSMFSQEAVASSQSLTTERSSTPNVAQTQPDSETPIIAPEQCAKQNEHDRKRHDPTHPGSHPAPTGIPSSVYSHFNPVPSAASSSAVQATIMYQTVQNAGNIYNYPYYNNFQQPVVPLQPNPFLGHPVPQPAYSHNDPNLAFQIQFQGPHQWQPMNMPHQQSFNHHFGQNYYQGPSPYHPGPNNMAGAAQRGLGSQQNGQAPPSSTQGEAPSSQDEAMAQQVPQSQSVPIIPPTQEPMRALGCEDALILFLIRRRAQSQTYSAVAKDLYTDLWQKMCRRQTIDRTRRPFNPEQEHICSKNNSQQYVPLVVFEYYARDLGMLNYARTLSQMDNRRLHRELIAATAIYNSRKFASNPCAECYSPNTQGTYPPTQQVPWYESRKIFVGGISKNVTEDDLRLLFGPLVFFIQHIKVLQNEPEPGGFITFSNRGEAEHAINIMQSYRYTTGPGRLRLSWGRRQPVSRIGQT